MYICIHSLPHTHCHHASSFIFPLSNPLAQPSLSSATVLFLKRNNPRSAALRTNLQHLPFRISILQTMLSASHNPHPLSFVLITQTFRIEFVWFLTNHLNLVILAHLLSFAQSCWWQWPLQMVTFARCGRTVQNSGNLDICLCLFNTSRLWFNF